MSLRETLGFEPTYHESDDSYTPSKSVISMMGAKKKWYHPKEFDNALTDSDRTVLVLGVDEAYVVCQNGKRYRGGNHPVELFVVVKHLIEAGYKVEYATLSGNSIVLEEFAMPVDDQPMMDFIEAEKPKWSNPSIISEVTAGLNDDSPYDAVYLPGGQGAILGLPQSTDTKAALQWFLANDKKVITICHGPSSLLSLSIDEAPEDFPFKDYKIACFPAMGDKGAATIGYLPGEMPWFFDEKLEALGMDNVSPMGMGVTHVDRNLISADNPFVADRLGRLAANILLGNRDS